MNIEEYLSSRSEQVHKELDRLIPAEPTSPHALLFQAARYSLLSPGKRLRPLLTLATTEALGGSPEEALVPACALEMIHTYSLIHDDLPCMDDDDLRRGKPSLHKVYEEGHAVLTGDFLLTYAHELLAKSPNLSAEQKIHLIQIISERAGANGMIGGQVVDLASEVKKVSWDILHFIHINKTAALISASLEFGGIIAKASPQDQKTLKQIGNYIGLSFQIVDDLLDMTGKSEHIGKPALSDLQKQKMTSVSLLGIEKAEQYAKELLASSVEQCRSLSHPSPFLEALLLKMVNRSF